MPTFMTVAESKMQEAVIPHQFVMAKDHFLQAFFVDEWDDQLVHACSLARRLMAFLTPMIASADRKSAAALTRPGMTGPLAGRPQPAIGLYRLPTTRRWPASGSSLPRAAATLIGAQFRTMEN